MAMAYEAAAYPSAGDPDVHAECSKVAGLSILTAPRGCWVRGWRLAAREWCRRAHRDRRGRGLRRFEAVLPCRAQFLDFMNPTRTPPHIV